MKTLVCAVVLGLAVVGAGYGVEAAREKNGKGGGEPSAAHQQKAFRWSGYVGILKLETIMEKLSSAPPTVEQQGQIKALREQTLEKVKAWGARQDVQQAREEWSKAKKSGDQAALKAAEARMKEVGDGSEFTTAYHEGLAGILSAEQMAKLFPLKKSAEKTAEKAPDATEAR